ncbi:MAG TPA: tRNA (adenosine(37)-N6)-dimethylallyltransferase MiaA [Acidobacteriaceae bacterium]|nr:tRNA (adenosine(37)-N6)-dimethylallyltransferase MiaA [Acidobacteriaceae bacterium]
MPPHTHPDPALIVLAGPTASGKTALALALAAGFPAEIVSCDSVAIYRGLDIGSAKPTAAERALVPHHLLDVLTLDQPATAGHYARLAREAIAGVSQRGKLPIVSGGTGLYLRALLDGLSPAPQRNDSLRTRLRVRAEKSPAHLHRVLTRLDPAAASSIHANDTPKLIRAIEVTLANRSPITAQWQLHGRDPLTGYRILRLGLNPPRAALYDRINRRAAAMFDRGLEEETSLLVEQYGYDARPLASLGYAQAIQVLRRELTREQAVELCAQGHRNYAKRQLTWFRRDPHIHWLPGFGSDPETQQSALSLVRAHLVPGNFAQDRPVTPA